MRRGTDSRGFSESPGWVLGQRGTWYWEVGAGAAVWQPWGALRLEQAPAQGLGAPGFREGGSPPSLHSPFGSLARCRLCIALGEGSLQGPEPRGARSQRVWLGGGSRSASGQALQALQSPFTSRHDRHQGSAVICVAD